MFLEAECTLEAHFFCLDSRKGIGDEGRDVYSHSRRPALGTALEYTCRA